MQQIQLTIENTSQDTILKFVASTMLTEGSHEYHNVEEAKDSTLVQQLFHLPFVKKVFVTSNFMAIERYAIVEWADVQEELRQVIEKYLNKHGGLFNQTNSTPNIVEVYAESTPNPAAMKFVTNRLLTSQNIEIQEQEDAALPRGPVWLRGLDPAAAGQRCGHQRRRKCARRSPNRQRPDYSATTCHSLRA